MSPRHHTAQAMPRRPDGDATLVGLADRLRARLEETEEAVRARVFAISDVAEAKDPAYALGLREAVSVALDYALTAIPREGAAQPPVPPPLLLQARLAARSGINLDTVLRRYFAGYSMINDVLVEEATEGGLDRDDLKRILRRLASLFDHVLDAISIEFQREAPGVVTPERRRIERVRRLLDGELVDTPGLGYEVEGHHVAYVAAGRGGDEAIQGIAASLDCRLLLVRPDHATTWGWLGGRRPPDLDHLAAAIRSHEKNLPPRLAMAHGEPGRDLAGWRLSHRQAVAALQVAQRRLAGVVRYRDVVLLVATLKDDLVTTSLRRLYLEPLQQERDRGETAVRTLRAYFAAGCNTSSTAAALSVHRDTVASRLRVIETRIGQPLHACAAELELALQLRELSVPL